MAMTTKEFAEANAGKIMVRYGGIRPDIIVGECVGYTAEYVIIKPASGSKFYKSPFHDLRSGDLVVPLSSSSLVSLFRISSIKSFKEVKQENPYPHICKKCNSPARQYKTFSMCSNLKCRNKKQVEYFKAIGSYVKVEIEQKTDKDGYLLCKTCAARVRIYVNETYICNDHHIDKYIPEPGNKAGCGIKDCRCPGVSWELRTFSGKYAWTAID